MPDLLPHQQRVLDEKNELDVKIIKLVTFLDGDVFPTLDKQDRYLLQRQLSGMEYYSEILGRRIERF